METNMLLAAIQPNHNQQLANFKAYSTEQNRFSDCLLRSIKIKDSSDGDIRETLAYAMGLIGLRGKTIALFQTEDMAFRVEFMRRHYENHTLAEVKLAFDKAVAGELDIAGKDGANAFENFSPEYIGKIMKAYRAWAGEFYKESGIERVLTAADPMYKILPPPEYDPRDWVEVYYQDFLAGQLRLQYIPEDVFDKAIDLFKIQISKRRIRRIVQIARDYIIAEYMAELIITNSQKKIGEYLKLKNAKEALERLELMDSCQDVRVNRYCAAYSLQEWFYCIKEGGFTTLKEPELQKGFVCLVYFRLPAHIPTPAVQNPVPATKTPKTAKNRAK